ncbi:MAG: T9SS type A sorting domain-containing protein [Candidatus Fibromonas sp.]|jgi:hypothetical protein|nr:T9SS type A sorting domain-containing protein [Candidatus Fibromonas sp.]
MKKAVFLPVFATMAMVSQAWSAPCKVDDLSVYCQWDTGCHAIDNAYGNPKEYPCGTKTSSDTTTLIGRCLSWGSLYTGVTNTGDGETCDGTLIGGNANKQPLGCCKWDNPECWTIWDTDEGSETKVEECKNGTNVFWSGACPTTSIGACPPNSSTPIYDGRTKSCGEVYCYWPENSETGAAEGCYKIVENVGTCPQEITNCRNNGVKKPKVFSDAACTIEISSSSTSSSSTNNTGNSSSSTNNTGNSSSSATTGNNYEYCKIGLECEKGPYTFEQCNDILKGIPTNSCGNSGNSSSSVTTGGSSSSAGSNSGSSSSGGSGSSSSAETLYAHCKIEGVCEEGPYTFERCVSLSGIPSNSCTTPIIVLPKPVHSNGINAMQNAVNLQLTSSAAVQIFDLKGNAVRSLKFAQGNYIVPLSDLPHGLYIVRASNASWKQTVKVMVK